ncbi:hypothetical protein B0F90DRAFT_1799015, partial [Multifurca ochricompacta]
ARVRGIRSGPRCGSGLCTPGQCLWARDKPAQPGKLHQAFLASEGRGSAP